MSKDGTNHLAPVSGLKTPRGGLQVSNLTKIIKKRPILQDVTFNVHRGEVVALLGPNGAGKTTCFQAVVGLIQVDLGKIVLGGENITDYPMYRRARRGLGYLPQEASIFRGLTVAENIRTVLEITESQEVEVRERLRVLLNDFGLMRIQNAPATALSGGERRRVEIARALAADPTYMLLDEPFAGVDPIAVGDIRTLVTELKSRGIGVLITDHNVRETLGIVDRAYILHEGRVLMHGTPSEIVAHEDVRKVYLGEEFKLS